MIKLRVKPGEVHTEITVFAGPPGHTLANTGTLMMTRFEADQLEYLLRSGAFWQQRDAAEDGIAVDPARLFDVEIDRG